ncbi:anti-CBASS protein Acb1 family protein [Marinibaculum pumilum]|uniref:Anti-CBASS protein Acb1 family protein n=1 Tax=Marinibaculum pumilum TaxID=1766165 RepID=A0ABV7KYS9_9PROT
MAESRVTKALSAIRGDGWANLLTRMGTRGDRMTRTSHSSTVRRLDRTELSAIYRSDGIGRRIIDIVAQEGTREWIEVEGDAEGELVYVLDQLKAKHHCRDLWRWARLYGGAVMVIGVDDGMEFDQPINTAAVRRVEFLRVYDRHRVTWTEQDLGRDPMRSTYGEPEVYTIQPYTIGTPYRVHADRVIVMQGAAIPEEERVRNQGWGDSELQPVYEALRTFGTGYSASANILTDFVQTVLSVKNLSELIAGGQDELVQKRLHLIDMSRSVLNTILLDADEQYAKQASSVAGLADLLDRFGGLLSGVTGIPQTKLLGRSPAGLNATGDADIRNFYDEIRDEQEDRLLPALNRLKDLIVASREGPWRGAEPADGLAITFRPLWQMTQEQEATYRLNVAQADKIYLETGVVDPSEVAISRFGGDAWSAETEIDAASRKVTAPPSAQEIEAQEQAAREAQAAALAAQQPAGTNPGAAEEDTE